MVPEETVKKRRTDTTHRRRPPLTVFAIGRDGWAVAEQPIDFVSAIVVESVADELRAAVLSDTGWTPTIVVVDRYGRDVTPDFKVD